MRRVNDQRHNANFLGMLAYSFTFGLGMCLVPLVWVMVFLMRRGRPSTESKLREIRSQSAG